MLFLQGHILLAKNILQDLVTSRLINVRRSRPGLAVFAFRFAQTKTSLRLSNPDAHKAVYALLTIKKPTFEVGF